VAGGAELVVENVPLTAACRSCKKTFHVSGYAFSCAHCGSPEIEITSGRELQIEDIDLEV
jgi:Zn finger protein HypA/HybF involved in hydrogenase expression